MNHVVEGHVSENMTGIIDMGSLDKVMGEREVPGKNVNRYLY